VVRTGITAHPYHGSFQFLRNYEPFPGAETYDFEHEFRLEGGKTYLVVFCTNTTDYSGKEDPGFASWTAPVIVPLSNNRVGSLPALPIVTKGEKRPAPILNGPPPTPDPTSLPNPPELTLTEAADALLYLGFNSALVFVGYAFC
jgi:hypothetical protein